MADSPSSNSPSRSSTSANNNARFTSQQQTAEEVLKEQTVGLVHLSDFRKRRLEAHDQVSRDGTPSGDGREGTSQPAKFKKRKKTVKKGGLSFGDEEEEDDSTNSAQNTEERKKASSTTEDTESEETPVFKKGKLRPNSSLSVQPKALTKSALLREAQLKDSLRKEFVLVQEAVKATEFCLPFVFFDGKDAPGGVCRMKKGDFVWLFLDKARKLGATTGGGGGRRQDWARIGVDDLMCVRGDLIIPHHFDFHHFILNQSVGYNNTPIFTYSREPTPATPSHLLPQNQPSASANDDDDEEPQPSTSSNLTTAADRKAAALTTPPSIPDSELEGFGDDAARTKVVDRRWYERNKHIYPASVWEEFDAKKDYGVGARKDGMGNAFFFSR